MSESMSVAWIELPHPGDSLFLLADASPNLQTSICHCLYLLSKQSINTEPRLGFLLNRPYTVAGLIVRLTPLYFSFLTFQSIYRAASPSLPHNKSQSTDYGALTLQELIVTVQKDFPRAWYSLQTAVQAGASALLGVGFNYSVDVAKFTGVYFVYAVICSVVVPVVLISWIVRLPSRMVKVLGDVIGT
ncbi:hypothetical protein AUEXF2481DRAFT_92057 [Aureobasidium subglaciale EXF-2481]|uniref:Uncharacterized protein n=1 Tax=Aureobasidium subglaciale (strain EXF-2481) TaxID=1043005 RepID=A0A074YXR7_AURSE|nr:uncharacterized protein AUEXF2481DRAFT_92057 [Aureobasidium subglaciale EXF-2481]KEQ91611.1 hypothetical protein AUEXF2481DRAFT_92057 [Aureobasidium subglaciale EXF-2481]